MQNDASQLANSGAACIYAKVSIDFSIIHVHVYVIESATIDVFVQHAAGLCTCI